MCCHVRSATVSRRRQRLIRGSVLPLPWLAVLELGKPHERAAHEFLLRATSKRNPMWTLLELRRHGAALLCVVRWANLDEGDRPFSVAELSLKGPSVCWMDYASAEAARNALARCGAESARIEEPR